MPKKLNSTNTVKPKMMKNFTLLLSAFMLTVTSLAQNKANVVLFTEHGEKFSAILNGIKQNDAPQANVRITDLNAEFYKLKVEFEDSSLPTMNKSLAVAFGQETTVMLKQNKKGVFVMRMLSQSPLEEAPAPASNQEVIAYHETPTETVEETATEVSSDVTVHETTTVTTTTTTESTDGTGGNSENVSMDVNVGGVNFSVDASASDNGGSVSMGSGGSTTTTTTHTTTTTTHTSADLDVDGDVDVTEEVVYVEGYNGEVGCAAPMNDSEFGSAKKSVGSKTFSDSKMTVAKQVTRANCLTAKQVKEITMLFDFESDRLDYAKYAYDYTYDKGNYYKVNDAFDFESSIEELNEHIESR